VPLPAVQDVPIGERVDFDYAACGDPLNWK